MPEEYQSGCSDGTNGRAARPGPGRCGWVLGCQRDYNRLVKAAGLPRIRIHDLRHTHVTLALHAGANVRAVSERVGHAGVSITLGTYAHVLPAQHVEVAAKVGAVLFAPPAAPAERP